MSFEEQLAFAAPSKRALVTVGVFDGVHLGHQRLIAELTGSAKKQGLTSIVITFKQHPQNLLQPGQATPFLTSLPAKICLLKKLDVDTVIPLDFTFELAQIGFQDFVMNLRKHLKMRGLVVGPDFALGRDRQGNIETLRRLKSGLDFSINVVPPVFLNGEPVSSTAIRNALASGDIIKANMMLGRPFSLEGSVIRGSGRGEDFGFPTANLDIDPGQALPQDGVYATLCYTGKLALPSATYIGTRPTFGETERVVETHIMGFAGDLYRRQIKIDIISRLRGDIKFASDDSLIKQMKKDVSEAEKLLGTGES